MKIFNESTMQYKIYVWIPLTLQYPRDSNIAYLRIRMRIQEDVAWF
jgi:hypothetical protein